MKYLHFTTKEWRSENLTRGLKKKKKKKSKTQQQQKQNKTKKTKTKKQTNKSMS